jgi:hypothetical protein
MDPYLEARGQWETLHAWLVPACAENLNPRLPGNYIAQPHFEAALIRLMKHESEVAERWIEILHLPEMELVTAIEILSPTNKVGSGRTDYLRKRIALIDQPVNLVEIDLLLSGRRMPAEGQFPPGDYYARAPDPDVALDLAEVFRVCYDRGEYARILRYGTPLPANFPISPQDRAWAESVGP